MGVPTFYVRLLADPEFGPGHCANMRLFISGSAPLQAKTWHEFKSRSGFEIVERYGMTECGMNTSNPLKGKRKPGTVGLPLDGVTLRVVGNAGEPLAPHEVGQIQFTGPNVFKGYWQNPEKTADDFTEDGFFKSGDLGYMDEDGYVCISGRDKDLIITGGYNVYPKEIELCIDEMAGVAESAVIGLPHEDFGEQVTAVIVAGDGETPPEEEEVIDALKQRLAGYKVPKRVFYLDSLPRNAMGKVQKNVLRERYEAEPKKSA
jgi:malonyl-CoA/methylmalonyl-CoA synthetase